MNAASDSAPCDFSLYTCARGGLIIGVGIRSRLEGMVIELLKDFPDNVTALVCHGQVTKADYETVLIPDVTERLSRHDKVRIYYELASDFTGFDPGAMWDDTKLGLSHFLSWERLAMVTDIDWIKHSVKLFGFLMPAQLRVFPTTEAAAAREWISQAAQ